MRLLYVAGCWLGVGLTSVALAAEATPIQYTLSFTDADRHVVDVEAVIPTDGKREVALMMPVWTPGSYLVREYARNIEQISAERVTDATSLAIEKTRKNRWVVETPAGTELIRLRYRLYCREMSVRTNWVERDFGCLNGASTFVTRADALDRPHRVRCVLPGSWAAAISAMPTAEQDERTFVAQDFDMLVDSPMVLGNPQVAEFTVDGIEHRLVTINDGGLWDNNAAAADVRRIVETQSEFWGGLPYPHYTFLNVVGESGGGLEHDNCTLLMTSRWAYRDPASYRRWLGLVSHEFFHVWNVRRLRPAELQRYDYERENYFNELWIAEGITSYYDNLLQLRAGLLTQEDYLQRVSRTIQRVMDAPGERVQALRDSSFDAWIKFYRPDANANNARMSYYTKGSLVAWLLDAKIRQATEGDKSLDDVMRLLYERHHVESSKAGYTTADFRACVDEVSGIELSAFLAATIDDNAELDFTVVETVWGLTLGDPGDDVSEKLAGEELDAPTAAERDAGEDRDAGEKLADAARRSAPERPSLGVDLRSEAGRMIVAQVVRGGPADRAGWNVDDELIALDGLRATESLWNDKLKFFEVGKPLKSLLSRRGQLIDRVVVPAAANVGRWKLRWAKPPSEAQQRQRQAWLKTTTGD